MNRWHRKIAFSAFFLLVVFAGVSVRIGAQGLKVSAKTSIGIGWHPWYEIKADPEDSRNLIICGTKWDALGNSPFGFVYATSDFGVTWHAVLEDKSSNWVTEHSCAFGQNHKAYFISEAAKIIDGHPTPELGTTRLFVSTDGGSHWVETIRTGWADYSTSAVSSTSGRLYTFFNSENSTQEQGGTRGGSVGLLIFSSDGKKVAGPFFDSGMRRLGYQGIFPSGALALRSGSVVALFYGKRLTSAGWEADIGIVRADQSREPSLEPVVISHPVMDWRKGCFNYANNSLAYNADDNRLFLLYVDGCKDKERMLLTSSVDDGRTWAESLPVADARELHRALYAPSLVARPGGLLGLLWEEGEDLRSARWLFSYIRDRELVEPLTELARSSNEYEVSNDSLRTALDQVGDIAVDEPSDSSSIMFRVLNELNIVWRGSGLIVAGNRILAVWPSGDSEGTRLNSGVLLPGDSAANETSLTDAKITSDRDVTRQTMLLYGGGQHFDSNTGTLRVCLALANRGNSPIRLPVKVKADDIRSPVGSISVINASNGLHGAGAIWNVSNSVTGDRIPPGSNSDPFCLFFHLEGHGKNISPLEQDDLVILKMKVLGSSDNSSERKTKSKN